MSTTNNGTRNRLPGSSLPSGYSRPSVTTFTDYEWTSKQTLSVLKATVDETDPDDTMQAIIANGTIGISKQVDDIMTAMGADAVTTTVYTDWNGLSNNYVSPSGGGDHLTDTAASYACTVTIYAKFS